LALTQAEWVQAFQEVGVSLSVKRFPWWLFKGIGLFSPIIREILKMRYLWQTNVILDGAKMEAVLGTGLQQTPLSEVVQTVVLKTPASADVKVALS
jgi:hypothetical protein